MRGFQPADPLGQRLKVYLLEQFQQPLIREIACVGRINDLAAQRTALHIGALWQEEHVFDGRMLHHAAAAVP